MQFDQKRGGGGERGRGGREEGEHLPETPLKSDDLDSR